MAQKLANGGVRFESTSDVDLETAQEMALVGIVPDFDGTTEIGTRFSMAGQNFVVTGLATREEFLEAVHVVGLGHHGFERCPAPYFYRVSTD